MPFVALQGRPMQSATIGYAITPNPIRPLIKYADRWNWAYIIDRYGDDSITYNEEFLEKYGDYISASELGGSKLWDNIIEHRIKAIKKKILS